MSVWTGLKRFAIATVMLIVLLAASYWFLKDNVHTVIPHQFYRSAQLSGPTFKRVMHQYRIRSLINLRGSNPDKPWYRTERRVADQLGVVHFDVRMNAYRLPTVSALKKLVFLLQHAPRPVLFHCEGGSDRTGLTAAIVMLLDNKPLSVARKQVSIRYFVTSKKSVGRLVLPMYAQWLKHHQWKSSSAHFVQWVNQVTFSEAQPR